MENLTTRRNLKSIGKKRFIELFYSTFVNDEKTSEECKQEIIDRDISNENGACIRYSNAKKYLIRN